MIPEYIKCTKKSSVDWGTNIIDRVYKVTGENRSDYYIEYLGKRCPSVDKSRFIPSTEKEYRNQFLKKQTEPQYEIY